MIRRLVHLADRVLGRVAPSAPPHVRAIVAAQQTPVPASCGEADAGTGQAPECEVAVQWSPHPSHGFEFTDFSLAVLVDSWKEQIR